MVYISTVVYKHFSLVILLILVSIQEWSESLFVGDINVYSSFKQNFKYFRLVLDFVFENFKERGKSLIIFSVNVKS